VEIGDGAIIKCNYEVCVKVVNKSNIKSETSSIFNLNRDTIISNLVKMHLVIDK
jgi:hypothetical protein